MINPIGRRETPPSTPPTHPPLDPGALPSALELEAAWARMSEASR